MGVDGAGIVDQEFSLQQFVWDLLDGGRRLMHVRYGTPSISVPGFPEAEFRADLPRGLPGVSAESADRLWGLARCAAGQARGCMLVISADAAGEADRLANQCTWVAPFRLDAAVVPLVTSIDRSILVDDNGVCHAVGVIPDGLASPGTRRSGGRRTTSRLATSPAGRTRWP